MQAIPHGANNRCYSGRLRVVALYLAVDVGSPSEKVIDDLLMTMLSKFVKRQVASGAPTSTSSLSVRLSTVSNKVEQLSGRVDIVAFAIPTRSSVPK